MGPFDILDTSPKATLDSQAEWSGGLIGSSTSRGILCAARLGGVQPCSAFNWRRPFGDTFRSTGWGLLIFWPLLPRLNLDSQAEWSGGLVGSSTSRG